MVRVPEYTRNVSLRPAFRQGVDVRATPEAFGASAGRGLQQAAAGLGQLANAAAAVQELEDSMRAKEADNDYAGWMRERMYGEGGFMTLSGRNAVEARKAFEEEAEQKRKEFGQDLTPGAARAYQQASQARVNSAFQQSIVHAAGERKRWFKDASDARQDTFLNDAVANYQQPEAVKKNIAAGIMELRQQGEMMGWDADTLSLREREYASSAHKSVALRIAQDDALKAQEYIDGLGDSLTEADRMALTDALDAPVAAAKGQQNAIGLLQGLPADDYEDDSGALPDGAAAAGGEQQPAVRNQSMTAAPRSFEEVTRDLIGMHEGRDAKAISDFIRQSAGIKINPRVTPWCAAFVNAVLGAQGIEGTGKLNARSFLNFGTAVDDPRPGDVVVFSRGNSEWQGHVGFFQGYDRNGNMIVLGGNQSNSVRTSTYSTDRLLGVRRAGPVTEQTAKMPNYNPASLGAMHERLMKISDPKEREATRKALDTYLTLQKKAADAQRDEVQTWVEAQIASNPSIDLMKLPPEVRTALGASGMTTMLNYQDKLQSAGDPTTDDRLLYDLQMMDPEELADLDVFQYRDRLSKSDWEKVRGWKQSALGDKRKARDESVKLKQAFGLATDQLQAAGIVKSGSKMTEADHKRVAQFNNSLAAMMDEFKRDEKNGGRAPNDIEIQSMINRLLLPVVTKKAGGGWLWGDSETESRLFEAGGELGEIAPGVSVSISTDYSDIPAADRVRIEAELSAVLGRDPSNAEVERVYDAYLKEQFEGED